MMKETTTREKVAIFGASDKPDRYSYKAFQLLRDYGHTVYPVSPRVKKIDDTSCLSALSELSTQGIPIDTVTMYVNETISTAAAHELLALKPRRVIFNPGAENPGLAAELTAQGIQVVEGCTLVMLRTGQF